MAEHLSDNEISNANLDKQNFYNTIINTRDRFNNKYCLPSVEILNFVRKFQDYNYESNGDINEYLYENGIQVGTYFAALSEQVGYPINEENIMGWSSSISNSSSNSSNPVHAHLNGDFWPSP